MALPPEFKRWMFDCDVEDDDDRYWFGSCAFIPGGIRHHP
jgi:hypothetical protein